MKGNCDSFNQFLNGNHVLLRAPLRAAAQTSGKWNWGERNGKRLFDGMKGREPTASPEF